MVLFTLADVKFWSELPDLQQYSRNESQLQWGEFSPNRHIFIMCRRYAAAVTDEVTDPDEDKVFWTRDDYRWRTWMAHAEDNSHDRRNMAADMIAEYLDYQWQKQANARALPNPNAIGKGISGIPSFMYRCGLAEIVSATRDSFDGLVKFKSTDEYTEKLLKKCDQLEDGWVRGDDWKVDAEDTFFIMPATEVSHRSHDMVLDPEKAEARESFTFQQSQFAEHTLNQLGLNPHRFLLQRHYTFIRGLTAQGYAIHWDDDAVANALDTILADSQFIEFYQRNKHEVTSMYPDARYPCIVQHPVSGEVLNPEATLKYLRFKADDALDALRSGYKGDPWQRQLNAVITFAKDHNIPLETLGITEGELTTLQAKSVELRGRLAAPPKAQGHVRGEGQRSALPKPDKPETPEE